MAGSISNTTISTLRDGTPYLANIPAFRPEPALSFTNEGPVLSYKYTVSTVNTSGQPMDIQEGDQIVEPGRAPGTVILRFDFPELGQMALTMIRAAGPA